MPSQKRIRVLIVDDSLMFRAAMSRGLSADEQIEVIATAANPYDARTKIMQTNPDVMTLDVEMPGMSGLEFLRILMPQHPMPVVVVSAVDGIVFEAMRAGAIDFIAKPEAGQMDAFIRELSAKIRIASIAKMRRTAPMLPLPDSRVNVIEKSKNARPSNLFASTLVAIGASTGGTEATSSILKSLSGDFPAVLITQHMPATFTKMYAERLNRESCLTVSEAVDGEPVLPGHAYVAPGGRQMRIVKAVPGYKIQLGSDEKVNGHCPSVDVLFDSVAEAAGKNAIGVILTGMGSDGANGLLKLRETGAYTIGQDQQSSVVYGMPMEAMRRGAVVRQASLEMIPNVLINQIRLAGRHER
ncbi:chemotaxis response regulator protein-glutamate methylesterase [Christensenellaceae bacterium OttesenSCG-928-L17]|nr:chemotaxis response regulator protein-glutamate methylesterase [Christensenellaceae bacterium OttesenSCG-928-L17]